MKMQTRLRSAGLCLALVTVTFVDGCGKPNAPSSAPSTSSTETSSTTDTSASVVPTGSPETAATSQPKELFKPAAGTGNVQGKTLFDDKPAANIEVTLSEKFSSFLGASGKSYTARSDKNGDYVLKNVPPKEYEGLTARVFNTDSVIFIKSGIIEAKKYTVEPGKTLFVEPTNLFKSDLKVISPKASATVPAKQAAFKWQSYPSAAYYKISISADDFKNNSGVYQERVDGTTYQTEKPLAAGSYRVEVAAYNTHDHKLAESPEGYKFRVAS